MPVTVPAAKPRQRRCRGSAGAEAAPVYQQALAAGLPGDDLRQALTQYGNILRNIGRQDEPWPG